MHRSGYVTLAILGSLFGLVMALPTLAQSPVERQLASESLTDEALAELSNETLEEEFEPPSAGEADAVSYELSDSTDAGKPCPKCGKPSDTDCCSPKKQKELAKKVKGSHKILFYDNDFSYLADPCYDDWHLGDHFKRLGTKDCVVVDVGGQFRMRQMSERNFRGLFLNGRDDDFLLYRTRLYANVEVGQRLRAYAEGIDAESNYEKFAPRAIEVDRTDMLNLFGDIKTWDGDQGDLWMRAGRQELLYGSQRLISPLDWGNTRRTFEGYKAFWKGKDWNVDAFYTRPVLVPPYRFNEPNYNEEFMGFFTTYKGFEKETVDGYFLVLNQELLRRSFQTAGGRWQAEHGDWLVEVEAAYQFGENSDGSNHAAGFFTTGCGRKLSDVAWTPTLWAYYDWASGGSVRGANHGFHHLFPLAHKYLGYMDLYGRTNLETPNLLLTLQPTEKLQLLAWGYYFFLENKNDTPYTVADTPINPGNAPASADLGYELDLTAAYQITPRMDILFGYSHYFAGEYYKLTPGLPYRGDADFYYTQLLVNF